MHVLEIHIVFERFTYDDYTILYYFIIKYKRIVETIKRIHSIFEMNLFGLQIKQVAFRKLVFF